MLASEIKPGIHGISVNDRTTDLFEGVWPIHDVGVTYNSYLIDDEKKVMVDLIKDFKTDSLVKQASRILDLRDLDYIVVNHMEPDHSGALNTFLKINDKAELLCTPKAVAMLRDYYGITERVRPVESGETITLGKYSLQFVHIPFVHWPETMATYVAEAKVLFSCDAFGGYGALPGSQFDDECDDLDWYIKESLRYYANIVAKFSKNTAAAIGKLADVPIDVICPSHGLMWRKDPQKIVSLYSKWANYAKGNNDAAVTLLYGSMYGNTETMMNFVAKGIADAGVPVEIFDVARTHPSYILPSVWKNAGVMIGAPTYEVGLFPPMVHALDELGIKRMMNKKAAYFGSYGWSGGALKKINSIIEPLKWEMTDTLEFQGGASDETLEKGLEFGRQFGELVKKIAEP